MKCLQSCLSLHFLGVSVIVQDTEMAHSIGIIEPPVHFPPVQADKEPANWIEFATRNRTRASTGGSSMVSDLGSFMDESEAKLTFSKTTNESYGKGCNTK